MLAARLLAQPAHSQNAAQTRDIELPFEHSKVETLLCSCIHFLHNLRSSALTLLPKSSTEVSPPVRGRCV